MSLYSFFDKLEDRVRARLSKHPLLYSFVSGVGTTLFFRGVWIIADSSTWLSYYWWSGWLTLGISLAILLTTGTFAFHFLSEQIVRSGIKQERKPIEKAARAIQEEAISLKDIKKDIEEIKQILKSKK